MASVESAPGLRFHPTDAELVSYYLKRKVLGKNLQFDGISVVDIYKHAPWDLPGKSAWKSNDRKWYFFCPRERKYAIGSRMNRSTDLGYWKTTGRERSITCNKEIVGKVKTLVFHRGKSPKGDRTDWVMYEYRLHDKELTEKGIDCGVFVLCAIFKKDGRGPKNGAQYGAPFCEEDWPDETDEVNTKEINSVTFILSEFSGPSCETPAIYDGNMPSSSNIPMIPTKHSYAQPSPLPLLFDYGNQIPLTEDDDIETMLNFFGVDDTLPVHVDNNELQKDSVPVMKAESMYDGIDTCDSLDDLETLDDNCFIELLDLDGPPNTNAHDQMGGKSVAGYFGSYQCNKRIVKEEGKEKSSDSKMESRGDLLVVRCSFDDDGFSFCVMAEVTLPSTKDALLHHSRSFFILFVSFFLLLYFLTCLQLSLFFIFSTRHY